MITSYIKAKYACFGFLAGLLIAAIVAWGYSLYVQRTSVQVGGVPTSLPDIPTPAGWWVDEKTPSQLIFMRNNNVRSSLYDSG
jgi:hypothetical protein